MAALAEAGRSYALLADGTTMTIRPAGPDDYGPVRQLHEAMSPDNLYFRFFSASRVIGRAGGPAGVPAGSTRGWWRCSACWAMRWWGSPATSSPPMPAAAEVALAVADGMHGRGIATLLLEHLVSLARARGVKVLVADVLPDNYPVLRVLSDAGLAVRRRFGNGVVELSMPVPPNAALGEASTYLDAVADREKQADVASLEPLLAPRSVAVVGAGRRPGSVGRTILLNIRDAGFAGALYAVSPHGGDIEGIRCVPSVADAARGPRPGGGGGAGGAGRGGGRGVREARRQIAGGDHLGPDAARRNPACWRRPGGAACAWSARTPSASRCRASGWGPRWRRTARSPGTTGLVVQSGGVGAALVEQFSRLGIGISSFASVGDKLDVSGTDMLLWWEADDTTELAVLYLESFGQPRRFARTARRVSARIPVLTVHAGRSAPGQRAAASHTAAAVAPLITRQALFDQAGIIATTSFGELLDAAVLMASQPIPAGTGRWPSCPTAAARAC